MRLSKTPTHSVGCYLPNTVTDMWDPSRDVAWLRLPSSPPGIKSIVGSSGCVLCPPFRVARTALFATSNMPQITVVSPEGSFYAYLSASFEYTNHPHRRPVPAFSDFYRLYSLPFPSPTPHTKPTPNANPKSNHKTRGSASTAPGSSRCLLHIGYGIGGAVGVYRADEAGKRARGS